MKNQTSQQTLYTLQMPRKSKYLYAYAEIKWTRRLKFVFFWALAHALAGAVGITLAEMAVRAPFWKTYSTIIGVIVFEGVIAIGKHLVFLRFKELRIIRYIDTLAWFFAGAIIFIVQLIKIDTYSESITLVSLDVLRLSAFLSLGIIFSLILSWIFNNKRKAHFKQWHTKLEEFIADRFFFALIRIPAYIGFGLLVFVAICMFLAVFFFAVLMLVLGPIEQFKILLEAMHGVYSRVFLFGGYSVGYGMLACSPGCSTRYECGLFTS